MRVQSIAHRARPRSAVMPLTWPASCCVFCTACGPPRGVEGSLGPGSTRKSRQAAAAPWSVAKTRDTPVALRASAALSFELASWRFQRGVGRPEQTQGRVAVCHGRCSARAYPRWHRQRSTHPLPYPCSARPCSPCLPVGPPANRGADSSGGGLPAPTDYCCLEQC